MITKSSVINETSRWVIWWLEERKKKLREQLSETMSVNPFLLPILFELHDLSSLSELNKLIVASHLMTGHATGFGKLMDEKILPKVFGTTKLDAPFRRQSKIYSKSCFDEVDHIIKRKNGNPDILSLKAGKWTIQLTMAVQLNAAFHEIKTNYGSSFGQIAVGVFYGTKAGLTDKYDILRGINRGKNHDVVDLTDQVFVYAGREFWSWLNDGEDQTQDWVIQGIKQGLAQDNSRKECGDLLKSFESTVEAKYRKYFQPGKDVNWEMLLTDING
ncbi:MAG: restriction endonuclease [Alphaproteobacteria bacterium]|nr:restriction endonuclease [Alphaproteobacteria bacterium]